MSWMLLSFCCCLFLIRIFYKMVARVQFSIFERCLLVLVVVLLLYCLLSPYTGRSLKPKKKFHQLRVVKLKNICARVYLHFNPYSLSLSVALVVAVLASCGLKILPKLLCLLFNAHMLQCDRVWITAKQKERREM